MLGLPPTASAHTSVRMKQIIRRIPCGIDHLTDANGINHYFAPRACGKLVVPSSGSEGSSPTTISGGGIITGSKPTYLESKSHMAGQSAYLLLARKGQVYTFRLSGDSVVSPLRTLEITQLTATGATFMFTPGYQEMTLQNAARLDADIAFDQNPDISIRIKDIKADNSVLLQLWFPAPRQMVGAVDDTMHSAAAVGIIGGIGATAIYVHLHTRYRIRRRLR